MPDHFHALVEGKAASADLRNFVGIAKQRAAHAARRWIHGRLWQPGYFERVLREGDDAPDVARYIVHNPMRAGLVESVIDYPFWGSETVSKDELIESTMWRP